MRTGSAPDGSVLPTDPAARPDIATIPEAGARRAALDLP